MLLVVGGDREGLLHKPVWFVPIAVRSSIRIVLITPGHTIAVRVLVEVVTAAFALHLAVGEKAARDPTGAP